MVSMNPAQPPRAPMNLDLRDLELVREVSRQGSLTGAARHLHVTQSALSHRLHDLEARLGMHLFERRARRMVPTRAGERLTETADRVLGELKVAWDDLHALGEGGVATLRIATACYTGYGWLSPVLAGFRRDHPGVEVVVDAASTHRAVDAVRAGVIDLALRPGPLEEEGLTTTPLFEDEIVLLMAPDHPLAAEPTVAPSRLADEHLLLYSDDPRKSFVLGGVLHPAGISPRRVTGVPLTEAIVELVKASQGVTALARWAVPAALEPAGLVARSLAPTPLRRTWTAVHLAREVDPPHLARFVSLLRQHLPAAMG